MGAMRGALFVAVTAAVTVGLARGMDEAGDLIPSNATDAAGANATVSCPPPGFNSVETFYCVRASYKQLGDDAVQVLNTANKGSVDGPQQNDGPPLKAVIPDLSDPSKLKVGLEFLPNESYGDYWVVFAGPDEGPYDYGIVSGGPPTLEGINGGGCVAGTPVQTNEAGLWLFTKEAEPEEETIEMLKQRRATLALICPSFCRWTTRDASTPHHSKKEI